MACFWAAVILARSANTLKSRLIVSKTTPVILRLAELLKDKMAAMRKVFKIGDHVRWNSEAGRVSNEENRMIVTIESETLKFQELRNNP